MTIRYMIDSNQLIEWMRGHNSVPMSHVNLAENQMAVSTIAVAELEYGVEHSANPAASRKTLLSLLSLFHVLPFDLDAAHHAGDIRHQLSLAGTPIGPHGVLIAGHARSLGITLVTHNTREFGRVPGLSIEDWHA